MKLFGIAGFALALFCTIGGARADDDLSRRSLEALVEDLAEINQPAPGLAGTAVYSAFITEDSVAVLQSGILGSAPPAIPAPMRELVRRGTAALPILMRHLADKRPTKLVIDSNLLMWRIFDEEYDPRTRVARSACDSACTESLFKRARAFRDAYTVKIGDVCFVLIGQIVNRNLTAVRYQPTGGLVVNSPIEKPSLAERIGSDWGNVDAPGLEASLRADVQAGNQRLFFEPALARLRFYFPDAYAALDGEDARKRAAFEADEQKGRAGK
jgi:hypothetical protein